MLLILKKRDAIWHVIHTKNKINTKHHHKLNIATLHSTSVPLTKHTTIKFLQLAPPQSSDIT